MISDLYSKKLILYKPYDKGQVLFESSTAGTYTLEIETLTKINIIMCGGGEGGAYTYSGKFARGTSSGAGAASFIGTVKLKKGTYSITVGSPGGAAGNWNGGGGCYNVSGTASKIVSNETNLIVCNSGTGGFCIHNSGTHINATGGTFAIDSTLSVVSGGGYVGENGRAAPNQAYNGGKSKVSIDYGTTYGNGGSSTCTSSNPGIVGYVKIQVA